MIRFIPGKSPLGMAGGCLGAGSYVRDSREGEQGLNSSWDREDAERGLDTRNMTGQWGVATATSKGRRK